MNVLKVKLSLRIRFAYLINGYKLSSKVDFERLTAHDNALGQIRYFYKGNKVTRIKLEHPQVSYGIMRGDGKVYSWIFKK